MWAKNEHNHESDEKRVEVKQLRVRIRKQSGDITSRPSKIILSRNTDSGRKFTRDKWLKKSGTVTIPRTPQRPTEKTEGMFMMLLMFWIWIQTKTSAFWLEILGNQALWSLRVLQIWNVFPTKSKKFLSTARLNVALNSSSNCIPYMDVKMGIMFHWCLQVLLPSKTEICYDQNWYMLHYMCREREV